MIESLLEELPPQSGYDHSGAKSVSASPAPSVNSFLASLPIIQRIVARRRSSVTPENGTDLVQEIALRLWRWRSSHEDTSEKMSGEDWKAFAARTAYNEVNRHLARESRSATLPLEDIPETAQETVERQTEIEIFSLITKVWQEICKLTLRQRQTLLLHSQDLFIYFLQVGFTDEEFAEILNIPWTDWATIRDRLPLTDAEIAKWIGGKPSAIKKARHDARVKLGGSIRK